MSKIRLDRFLADRGVATRSQLKEIVRSGRIQVNDVVVKEPQTKLDPDLDCVSLDGQLLSTARMRYLMMDKPLGVVTATEDPKEKTVLDLLTPELRRAGLFPVGRLDKDTTGLLLLTNDGDFAHRVISPKSAVEKCYSARVDGEVDEEDVKAFREGLILRDGTRCLPADLEPAGEGRCLVRVTEGKYHQVKRMLASRGKPVLELRRLSIGGLSLDESLGSGGWKELDQTALCSLFSALPMAKTSKKQPKF